MRRLTFGGNNRFPVWSPDSSRITFQSDRDGDLGVFWQRADGTGTVERLTKPNQALAHVPESWPPTAEPVALREHQAAESTLWTLSLSGQEDASPSAASNRPVPLGAVFSPDGRWVAYSSNEAGANRVYVQPFPATGAKYQLYAREGDPGTTSSGRRTAKSCSTIPVRPPTKS